MSDKLLFTGGITVGPQIVNAGCWIMNGSFHVYVATRPKWIHRVMARMLLGWVWEDSKR